jgi:hypothetical protein
MRSEIGPRRIAVVAILLALSVLLALLAHDVWRWNTAISAGDTRSEAQAVSPSTYTASTVLPGGFVRNVLGIDDDLAYRRAVAGAIGVILQAPTATSASRKAIVVETQLARLTQSDPDKARASRAADYLGLLFYAERNNPDQVISPYANPNEPAAPDQSKTTTPEQKAETEFDLAVQLDPSNASAKRHLEEMLHQIHPQSKRVSARNGNGQAIGKGGAGSRAPGYGY